MDNLFTLGTLTKVNFSGSLINWVLENIKHKSRILELGSGYGSSLLAERGSFYYTCIEHKEKYIGKFSNINYVHAPIVHHKPVKGFPHDKWYNKEIITYIDHNYDLLIIDGPTANEGRSGFIKYIDLFKTNIPIIFDDVNRSLDMKVAIKVSGKLKRPITIMDTWNEKGKHWGLIL